VEEFEEEIIQPSGDQDPSIDLRFLSSLSFTLMRLRIYTLLLLVLTR